MSGCHAGVYCEGPYCPPIRQMNEVRKTGARYLKPGKYKDMQLLMLPIGSTIFEAWDGALATIPLIKGLLRCAPHDAESWTTPCKVGVVLQGCANIAAMCWDGAEDATIEYLIACMTCCIVFEGDYCGCPEDMETVVEKKAPALDLTGIEDIDVVKTENQDAENVGRTGDPGAYPDADPVVDPVVDPLVAAGGEGGGENTETGASASNSGGDL